MCLTHFWFSSYVGTIFRMKKVCFSFAECSIFIMQITHLYCFKQNKGNEYYNENVFYVYQMLISINLNVISGFAPLIKKKVSIPALFSSVLNSSELLSAFWSNISDVFFYIFTSLFIFQYFILSSDYDSTSYDSQSGFHLRMKWTMHLASAENSSEKIPLKSNQYTFLFSQIKLIVENGSRALNLDKNY